MYFCGDFVKKLHKSMDEPAGDAPAKETIADYLKSWGLEQYIAKFYGKCVTRQSE